MRLSVVGNVERSAPDLDKMKAKTKKLRDAAQTLLKEAGRPANEIAGSTSLETLTEALATAVKECPNDRLAIPNDRPLGAYGVQSNAPHLGVGWRVA